MADEPRLKLLLLEEAASTQDELIARLRSGEDLDAVATGSQTAGRGRHGRAWIAAAGDSLALSVAVRAPASPSALPFAGMAAAARIAARYGASVRWPNDVVVGELKLAGILVEATEIAGQRTLIVGVGVNLAQREFPPELRPIAASLLLAFGHAPDWRTEAAAVTKIVARPAPESWAEIAPEWMACDRTPGKLFRLPNGTAHRALGVDEEGRLILDEPSRRPVTAAEAFFGE